MTGASCRIYFWICKNLQNFFWKNKYSVFLTQNENWGISQHWILHNDSGHRNVRQHPCLWNDWWRLLQVRLWSIIKLHLFFSMCVYILCTYSGLLLSLVTYCFPPVNSRANHSVVPYHYYEQNRINECKMYKVHEHTQRGGHRFITEKAIYAKWAARHRIEFKHPSWSLWRMRLSFTGNKW